MTDMDLADPPPLLDGDSDDPGLRTPPHNLEAEQALLGAILDDNQIFENACESLLPEHFFDPVNAHIFAAAGTLIERGQVADAVTLKTHLENDGALEDVGGTRYLARLLGSMVGRYNAAEYARIIRDLALRRELIAIGKEIVGRAYDPEMESDGGDQIEEAEQRLFELADTGRPESGFLDFATALKQAVDTADTAMKRDTHITGVTCGLRDLDGMLGGLHNSDLVVLAARPSMGKTALATKIAFSAAKAFHDSGGTEGAQVAFFSLEMSAEQLANRLLAEQAQVRSDKIRRGEITMDDFNRFVEVTRELSAVPLFIDETPALSVAALRSRARRMKRQKGLGLIVVDYLQLMQGSARSENRVQEISQITRGLESIAKELNLPVLALSQLSRAVEQRDPKIPQLSDLRESGTIEQDADVVMFIYREEYYLARSEPKRREGEADEKYMERIQQHKEQMATVHNEAEVHIAKQRHGPTGIVELFFEGQHTKFGDLDKIHGDIPR
jgi:replicative DNA helicase